MIVLALEENDRDYKECEEQVIQNVWEHNELMHLQR